jgi:hypothetical protein
MSMAPTTTATDLAGLTGYAGYPCILFPASRPLTALESETLLRSLNGFLGGWASHGSPVDGAGTVLEQRFVIVAHRPLEIAGCSRDALLFFLKDTATNLGLEWVGGSRVFYRDSSGIVVDVDRPGFRALAAAGTITPETEVFDTTIRETDALLNGKFAVPAKESWHAKLMPVSTP